MRIRLECAAAAVGLLAVVVLGQSAAAQSFSFPVGGFTTNNVCANSSTPPPACQVLTNGSPSKPKVISGGILRLTTANQNQHASAWFKLQQPLASGFTTAFQFQITNTNSCFHCSFPADGLALVIQNDPAGTGALGYTGNGQNLAYGNNDVSTANKPGKAILNSLAIELDTHLNSDYGDPDGNHIAVQSCGPNNTSTLSPNSADHNYLCASGSPAKLALQSLPTGLSLTDGLTHTITVNYLPPDSCTDSCNNLSVYVDSTLILQTTVNLATQLNLTSGSSAYVGFTAATGSSVQNNDIVSWTFSQWPLSPITINEPVQPTSPTNFNYTSNLNAVTDYSQSGLPPNSFQGLFMQGTVTTITDQQYADLVNNTPFQGSTCQHQDTGNGSYACVVTTDLCTTPTSSVASGANCLTTGSDPLIIVSNTYNLDPAQKPVIAPGYIMGKDNALTCGASADNTCKGLVSIFTSISGDALTSGGRTNNFNSLLIPNLGVVQPSTSVTTDPPLNSGWINRTVNVNFNSIETVPSNNTNPPATLPTIASIAYTATGANVPTPASGMLTGPSGSISIPVNVEGTTVISYAATDSSKIVETQVTNSGNDVSSSTPTFTFRTDLTLPTVNCTPPSGGTWQASDVVVPCTASDNASGSGLAGQSSFTVQTNVAANTETNNATIPAVTVNDVAGNTSSPQGPFGPFEVDKKAPGISSPTISPSSPVFGQSVNASYECTDGGSGVVLCGPSGSSQIPPTADTGALTSPADSTVGTHTFTVNGQDLVGNASVPSSVTYTVGKATPVVTWSNPASITYGTALSVAQLNATASVPGAFVYSPAAGIVLGVGTQTLSVTFAPSDTANYTTASKTVSLTVTQAASTTTITSISPNPTGTGTPVAVTFSVAGVGGAALPTGTVTVKANTGETCSAAVLAGNCSLTFATAGTRTITATYGGDANYLGSSNSGSVTVNGGDFSISATPPSQTISSGHQAVYTITLTPIAGYTGSVNLSCSGGPKNSTCTISPPVDNLQGNPVYSTVTLLANKNCDHGTFTLTFKGTSGSLVHTTTVSLTVKGGGGH